MERTGKILIMDDEEMVGDIACQMLTHLGYTATHVKDGHEAIAEYQRCLETDEHYDLVVMDLAIPEGMGGKEAVSKIRAIDENAKVLVSSGYSTDPIVTNYREYGFVGVINKPYDLASLKKIIESFI